MSRSSPADSSPSDSRNPVAILLRELRELGLDLGGEGNELRVLAARRDRLAQTREMAALVPRQLAVRHVRRVENRLEREQRQRREHDAVVLAERRVPERASLGERRERALERPSSASASLSPVFDARFTRSSRFSTTERSASASSNSITSRSRTGSTAPITCSTSSSSNARTTCTIASVSRMFARN